MNKRILAITLIVSFMSGCIPLAVKQTNEKSGNNLKPIICADGLKINDAPYLVGFLIKGTTLSNDNEIYKISIKDNGDIKLIPIETVSPPNILNVKDFSIINGQRYYLDFDNDTFYKVSIQENKWIFTKVKAFLGTEEVGLWLSNGGEKSSDNK